MRLASVVAAAVLLASAIAPAQTPHLLRNPSLSPDRIVFRYADDLWTVPREGGVARRLTSLGTITGSPRVSPDGRTVAFSARSNDASDVFTISIDGGVAKRLTWNPGGNDAAGWTPDGRSVLVLNGLTSFNDFSRLSLVHADGSGLPQDAPLPSVDEVTYSPDGTHVAYNPFNQWQAPSWKRYRGGQTEPVWIVDMKSLDLVKVPRDNSNDRFPVWLGDTVYFLSDRNGPVTLFGYNTRTKEVKQLVENHGLDLKSLQGLGTTLVYEQFGTIHLFDTTTGQEHAVNITLDGDLPQLTPRLAKIKPSEVQNFAISPTGVRAVFEAHGDIFTVPAEKGDVRNLTGTSNAAEREPSWSPDGTRLAYFSDEKGEYALYLRDQNGLKPPTVIDLGPDPTYYYAPHWSPDSKRIVFADKRLNLWYVNVDPALGPAKLIKVDTDTHEGFQPTGFSASFSPDGKWILYARSLPSLETAAFLYSIESGKSTQITDGMSNVTNPVFDASGKYIYFLASTDIGPAIDGFNLSSFNRTATFSAYVATLAKDTPSPLPPESDDEKAKSDADKKGSPADDKASDEKKDAAKKSAKGKDKEDGKDDKKDEKKDGLPVVKVDLDGIQQRTLALPIPARDYVVLQPGKEGVVLLGEGTAAPNTAVDGPQQLRSVWRFTLSKRQTEDVLHNVSGFVVSFDGDKVLYNRQDSAWIASQDDLKPGGADGAPGKQLRVDGMQARIDPRAEWQQIYRETWRIEREFFYDPGFHGLDLAKISAKYQPYVAGLSCRSDLTYLQQEMLGEITVGHMFVRGPGEERNPTTGMLGADYTVDHDRYKFSRILRGANWTPSLYAPLTQPGVEVHEGEYLLAVNSVPLHASDNLYAAFDGLAGRQTSITVGPSADDKGSRDVVVVPVASEHEMREVQWVEDNIAKVDRMSGGQVAYVYLPNTGSGGFNSFNRYFFSQTQKKAVVIDERYNEGGDIADWVIDVLKRTPMLNYESRQGVRVTEPSGAIFGPKAMLINQSAGSGGDAMPWLFRQAKLGPLVGVRTWGGLVGIGGYPTLLDGGGITAPRTALYGLHGEFEIENIGVSPDVEVEYDPKSVAEGRDPQLERGVQIVLDELKKNPPQQFPVPPYPNYHKTDGLGR